MPLHSTVSLFEASRHAHSSVDTGATLRRLRVERGQCPGCGTECYRMRSKLFTKSLIALTIDGVVSHGRCLYCNPDYQIAVPQDGAARQNGLARQNTPATEFDNSSIGASFLSVETILQPTLRSTSQASVTITEAQQAVASESLRTSHEDVVDKGPAGEEASVPEKRADTRSCTIEERSTAEQPESVSVSHSADFDSNKAVAGTDSISDADSTQEQGHALLNVRSRANQHKHLSLLGAPITVSDLRQSFCCSPIPSALCAQRAALLTPIPDLQEISHESLSSMSDMNANTRFSSGQWSGTSAEPSGCGHTDWIQSLALMSPNRVLSGADDASIKLWSTSGRCIRTYTGHTDLIWCVASLDDSSFLSASQDKTIKLWDVDTGACAHTFEGHSGPVKSVAQMGLFSFLSGSGDRTIKLWDATTKKCLHTFCNGAKQGWTKKGHKGEVNALAKLDTDSFLSGSDDTTVKLWDAVDDVVVTTFKGHKAFVHSIAKLGTDCQSFASGSEDGTARIWDVRSGKCTGVLHGHTKCIREVGQMNDNQLLTASGDKTVKLWDTRSDRCLHTFYDHEDEVTCVLRLDEKRFLSGSADKSVKMWSYRTGECLKTFPGPVCNIRAPKRYLMLPKVHKQAVMSAVNSWPRTRSANCGVLAGSNAAFGTNATY